LGRISTALGDFGARSGTRKRDFREAVTMLLHCAAPVRESPFARAAVASSILAQGARRAVLLTIPPER
jgi:hypothetical protein